LGRSLYTPSGAEGPPATAFGVSDALWSGRATAFYDDKARWGLVCCARSPFDTPVRLLA